MKRFALIMAALAVCANAAAQTDDSSTETPNEPEATMPMSSPQLWQVCNETSFVLRLAIASPVSGKMTPRGWTRIRPGDCATPDGTVGIQRFIYAESSRAHQGGIREWKGSTRLCAGDTDFTADATIDCALQDLSLRGYIPVSPDDPVTSFVEEREFGSKAATAGIQRLLKDNGYEISRVDGLSGRRTNRTLSKFLEERELPKNLSIPEQIDALEEAAFNYVQDIGLSVCNKSTEHVWIALGLRKLGNWESRGWWSVAPDTCLQPYTETLKGADLHLYALQEDTPEDPEAEDPRPDRKLISRAIQPAQFCIAEARFSALGRENCADKGYHAADFRILPTDKDGTVINLTDADFAAPSAVGLRR